MHSTFSDGVLAPELLVEHAVMAGVNVMALTDHDTMAGVDSLQGRELPIQLLPGVELSLRDLHGLHLLGYGFGRAQKLRAVLHDLEDKRLRRAQTMLERLAGLGMPLTWQAVAGNSRGTVGRAHIARAMVQAGYVSNMQAAFRRFLAEGKAAYVPGERLSMAEALPLLRSCGYVPVLAHPMELKKNETTLQMLLCHWAEEGLMGVEAYHPTARGSQAARLDSMARRMGLLVTGGSDFHQDGDSHGAIGCSMATWQGMDEDVRMLVSCMRDMWTD